MSSATQPIEVFQAAVDALNRENWHRLSTLCDPESLAEFKRGLLESLAPPKPTARLTATELMKAVPNMPRAVAEYQVSRFRETLDPTRRLRDAVPGVTSRRELEMLKPAEVFALWLEGRSARRQLDRHVERKQMSRATANEIIADGARQFDFVTLGFVPDGEGMGHIVYRRKQPGSRPLTTMARRQANGDWLLVADEHFLTVDEALLLPELDDDSLSS
jgi:hypothetical protein